MIYELIICQLFHENLKKSHHIIGLDLYHIALQELYETPHRCLHIYHRIMCPFEPFVKEKLVKLSEFWWLVGKSSPLEFAIVGG